MRKSNKNFCFEIDHLLEPSYGEKQSGQLLIRLNQQILAYRVRLLNNFEIQTMKAHQVYFILSKISRICNIN
jgi:hypothetical protein